MKSAKVTFENGDSFTTSINGTTESITKYYLNKVFNIGSVEDNLQRCIKVEVFQKLGGEHMTINEAMTLLGVSRTTLSKFLSSGKIKHKRKADGTYDLNERSVLKLKAYRLENPPRRGRKA